MHTAASTIRRVVSASQVRKRQGQRAQVPEHNHVTAGPGPAYGCAAGATLAPALADRLAGVSLVHRHRVGIAVAPLRRFLNHPGPATAPGGNPSQAKPAGQRVEPLTQLLRGTASQAGAPAPSARTGGDRRSTDRQLQHARHVDVAITDASLRYCRNEAAIDPGVALDGICSLRQPVRAAIRYGRYRVRTQNLVLSNTRSGR